jgi:hypothetical protein
MIGARHTQAEIYSLCDQAPATGRFPMIIWDGSQKPCEPCCARGVPKIKKR